MSIRDDLRAAIEASGKSHNQIAEDTGIRQSVISRFVSGERGITLATLEKLAAHFGLGLRAVDPSPAKRPKSK